MLTCINPDCSKENLASAHFCQFCGNPFLLNDRYQLLHNQEQDDLSGEKGIDYTRLRDLLKAQQWEEADSETYGVMLRAVGKKLGGDWFTSSNELLNFPCKDLKTIDSLWVKYSSGHFGFSVQKQIYVECGAKLDGKYPGDEIWEKFIDRTGWRVEFIDLIGWRVIRNINIDYTDLKFSTSRSLMGELPGFFLLGRCGVASKVGGGCWWFYSLASRLVNCSIQ